MDRESGGFRPEIEGLRGLAVALVVAYHAGFGGLLPGGFIGVDLFFVISGFLITGLLADEVATRGRIDLAAFYARRARRILPAALAVLALTLAVAVALSAPLDRPALGADAAAAALSAVNVRFALVDADYFAPSAPSPFRHYWSLSLEEQFYLLWPLLLGAGARRGRRGLGVAVALVGAGSLLAALTSGGGPFAFYGLPTRAWQLAAGGLLALGSARIERLSARIRAGLGAGGLIAVALAARLVGPELPYPGPLALLPTAGALALIAAGPIGPAGRLLSSRSMRWLGRISFSLYLVHWPLLVLAAPADPTLLAAAPALLASLVLAIVLHRYVEEPFRRAQVPIARAGTSLQLRSAAGALVAFALVASIGSSLGGPVAVAADPEPSEAPPAISFDELSPAPPLAATRAPTPRPAAVVSPAPSLAPSPTASPVDPTSAPPTSSVQPGPSTTPSARPSDPGWRYASVALDGGARGARGPLGSSVRPALARARTDSEPLFRDRCGVDHSPTKPPLCRYGRRDSQIVVALVGDSHAAHLFGGMRRLAEQEGWLLVPFTKSSCPWVEAPVWARHLGREYRECATWRMNVVAALERLRPSLVVVSSSRWAMLLPESDRTDAAVGAAMARALERIRFPRVVLVDGAYYVSDVPGCLSAHQDAVERCAKSRTAVLFRAGARERIAARSAGVALLDLTRAACPSNPCPVVVNSMIVYRDDHHYTYTFSRSLAPLLREGFARLGLLGLVPTSSPSPSAPPATPPPNAEPSVAPTPPVASPPPPVASPSLEPSAIPSPSPA